MGQALDFTPRLMNAHMAAHYLGVSESMLRTLPIPRKQLGAKRLYDRFALDAYANGLETEGETEGKAEWEKAFD